MPNVDSAIRVPKHRRHKPSGQAVVTLSGPELLPGQMGHEGQPSRVPAAGWRMARRRRVPPSDESLTIAELALAYWGYAKENCPDCPTPHRPGRSFLFFPPGWGRFPAENPSAEVVWKNLRFLCQQFPERYKEWP